MGMEDLIIYTMDSVWIDGILHLTGLTKRYKVATPSVTVIA